MRNEFSFIHNSFVYLDLPAAVIDIRDRENVGCSNIVGMLVYVRYKTDIRQFYRTQLFAIDFKARTVNMFWWKKRRRRFFMFSRFSNIVS